jgi:hypothetical protein
MATGSIAPEINLMIYPLKVLLAEEETAPAPARQEEEAPPQEEQVAEAPPPPESEKDLSVLTATTDSEVEKLAYKVIQSKDPRAGLERLERQLDDLMRTGQFCQNAQTVDRLAHQILLLAPYDKAAYHALVNTGVVQQDMKMVYLMSMIGRKALFFSHLYSYDLPQSVDAKLGFWQESVFNAARERSGRKLELEVVGCDGSVQKRGIPAELLAVDLPQEALRVIASKKVRVNFQQFKNLDDSRFLNRLFRLVSQAVRIGSENGAGKKPVVLTLSGAKAQAAGLLELDLSQVDILGNRGRLPFRLRRARGEWLSYSSDHDRRKQLLLPAGNYYLMLNKKVVKAFSIVSDKTTHVAVDVVRR